MVNYLMGRYTVRMRQACRCVQMTRSMCYYRHYGIERHDPRNRCCLDAEVTQALSIVGSGAAGPVASRLLSYEASPGGSRAAGRPASRSGRPSPDRRSYRCGQPCSVSSINFPGTAFLRYPISSIWSVHRRGSWIPSHYFTITFRRLSFLETGARSGSAPKTKYRARASTAQFS